MVCPKTVALLVAVVCVGQTIQVFGSNDFTITLRMPNATSDGPDALVCHGIRLPKKESYILRFDPHASMKVAHHMVVYGCSHPGSDDPFWTCPLFKISEDEVGICRSSHRQIVYAWANDAPARNLPDGVGFRVGGTTGIDYLVVQMHYKDAFGVDAADTSGVTLRMTYERQPQQASYYVMGNSGTIPPGLTAYRMESACNMQLNYTIYPIGYRTHGHNLAVVYSGYLVRDGVWTELGRMSPQRPQTFYNMTTPGLEIRNGDILASRCTFNSMNRTQITMIGPTNHDEMCNFYILYSTYEQKDLTLSYCFRNNHFAWSDYFNHTPPDASSLNGIPGADEIRQQFNMNPRR